jgi:hypothetical protein
MRDLHNNIAVKRGIVPAAAVTDNTPIVSAIADTLGNDSAEFLILTGALTDADATFSVLLEDGNDPALADNAPVADDFLLGTEMEASFLFSDDNKVFKIGYRGPKRYLRVTVTPSGNTSNVFVAGVWVLGHPTSAPTSNPPT